MTTFYQRIQQFFLISCLILFSTISLFAQQKTATIKGKITTPDGKTAEFVSINLEGTNKSTLSNEQGKYEINNIELGEYTIVVKSIGNEIISKHRKS